MHHRPLWIHCQPPGEDGSRACDVYWQSGGVHANGIFEWSPEIEVCDPGNLIVADLRYDDGYLIPYEYHFGPPERRWAFYRLGADRIASIEQRFAELGWPLRRIEIEEMGYDCRDRYHAETETGEVIQDFVWDEFVRIQMH